MSLQVSPEYLPYNVSTDSISWRLLALGDEYVRSRALACELLLSAVAPYHQTEEKSGCLKHSRCTIPGRSIS
jgi:hypothetical protein